MKRIIPFFLLILFAAGCMKKEAALPTPGIVKLNIKGFSIGDTLEFVHDGNVVATAAANLGFDETVLMSIKMDKENISVQKKGGTEAIGNFDVNTAPFSQTKRIYFDGTALIDNVELTPVSDPANMGLRVSFKTSYPCFSGAPVDVELFEQLWDMNTFEIAYRPLNIIIPDVGSSFSGFYELPELISTPEMFRSYKFKVYKAGTKEPALTDKADLSFLPDSQNHYGSIYFVPGESQLLIIDFNYDAATLFEDFYVQDIATLFQ